MFPICWLVCVFLPCCTKFNSTHDKRAATLSGVMLATIVAIVVLKFGQGVNEGRAPRYSEIYYMP
jgi:hypothetical protein